MVRMHPYDSKPVRVIVREVPADRPNLDGSRSAMDPKTESTAWSAKITQQRQASLAAILECGNLLRQAKDRLAHGEFQNMIERDLPFGPRTAQRLMALAAHPCITNATYASHLPGSWDTLYELTKLSDAAFGERVADGSIHPEMSKREAAALRARLGVVFDQLDLFSPQDFLLSSTGRKLEKAMSRHAYAQVKLTKNCELIIGFVITSIRELERLVSEISPPAGFERIEAELSRLETSVHRLMGPCRIPAAKREPAGSES